MNLPKIKEVRNLDVKELENEILSVRKELFELRLKRSTRQYFKPHLFKHAQHRLRQLLLILSQKSTENNFKG